MLHHSFSDSLPDDRLYCCVSDMWVQQQEGIVLIGVTRFGLHLAGEVIAFTSKPEGAEIQRGKGMATIECHKTVLAVHAPLSFRLMSGNSLAEARPALINTLPYEDGWMARGTPLTWATEHSTLCRADGYKRHILSIDPEAQIEL